AAKPMIGRTPPSIRVMRPIRDGVIADVEAAAKMLTIFIRRALAQPTLFSPRLLICVPAETTAVEQRAIEEVARYTGARHVQFIEEPLAAAVGVGIKTEAACASAIIDIGAETVEFAVLNLGGMMRAKTWRTGGRAMDRAIARHLRENRGLEVGEETAEMIKRALGSAAPHQGELFIEAGGRSLETMRPARIGVTSAEVQTVLTPVVAEIVRAVTTSLEELPPEIAADLIESGVMLTGGGAQLPGLPERLSQEIGLMVCLTANPTLAAVTGAARILWPDATALGMRSLIEPIASNATATPD
ncbi:MAG TPA: rod shape-determining protein, partial [Pyrinomonadaceae bacterium]|nr:rod shape-determining protein [Pyrinomonadaceae bacterium]